jgi:hypothetical protein
MLSSKKLAKCVVPRLFPKGISKEDKILKTHITAMLCFSASGSKVPPFIILPGLKKLPEELQTFYRSTITSSANGWMTRGLFEVWSHHFVRWLSVHRQSLPHHLRNERITLILDGHISRTN